MHLELLLSNDPRTLSGARGLLNEALRQLPLSESLASGLQNLIVDKVRDAIEHAYPPGEEGAIRLVVMEKSGRLEILVRDDGLPQDVAALEQRLHHPAALSAGLFQELDEVHWLSYGREGKAFQVVKWLQETKIADAPLSPLAGQPPLAPQQNYEIRRLRADEAVQVSQLMYRAYGNTYFNEDVYIPDRVAALNAHDVNLSFVAVGEDGTVAGHYALERDQPGPVAEGGQAVVDPAHRGRGLLEKLKAAALDAARSLDLTGWYGDAVTVHTMTQKSNAEHDGRLCAANLAMAPRSEHFRNIAESLPQRVTCLLYFHWLKSPSSRTVSVPQRHRDIVSRLYAGLECSVEFLTPQRASDPGTLTVHVEPGGRKAFLRADQPGSDTVHRIAHAQRELTEQAGMEVVYVELPLQHPATGMIADDLEQWGFGFLGVLPHFSPDGDLLRLGYLVEPLQREPIKTYDAAAGDLVDYTLAEQLRVRSGL